MIHSIGHKSLSGTYAVNAPVMTKRAGRLESVVLELFTRSANVVGVEGFTSIARVAMVIDRVSPGREARYPVPRRVPGRPLVQRGIARAACPRPCETW